MQIVSLFVLSWVGDPHWVLRGACDPANGSLQPGGLSCRRGWLLRERLRGTSGQAFVCLFPSVNTRKPHPVLQPDIQKSILNCRLGCSAGAKWLEAQDSVPRFRTPDRW